MKHLADEIAQVFGDYHSYLGYNFTAEHVLRWVQQFDDQDQQFILEEFLHILRQGIYVSEAIARQHLVETVIYLSRKYRFAQVTDFLKHADFLDMQPPQKSQGVFLGLLNDEITNSYRINLVDCGSVSKKYAIYIDDVLATGKTIYDDSIAWLEQIDDDGISNFDKVVSRDKIFIIVVFCDHAAANIDWRLKLYFKTDSILNKIVRLNFYEIQNHPTFRNQRFNHAYPNSNQPGFVAAYLDNLPAQYDEKYAYRKDNTPEQETFFSSAQSRIRFENIILHKGIEILNRALNLRTNHRPLGVITPSKKTFGTGTLFFTWRNISNTTPIVFWWGAHWYPLFPLFNRGRN